jgi:hypothetical protein
MCMFVGGAAGRRNRRKLREKPLAQGRDGYCFAGGGEAETVLSDVTTHPEVANVHAESLCGAVNRCGNRRDWKEA